MRRLLIAAAGLVLFAAIPAGGEELRTGSDLLRQCRAAQPTDCTDFLTKAAARLANDEALCLPEGYDVEQLREAFVAWAQDNADQIAMPVNDALAAALKDAFPCEE